MEGGGGGGGGGERFIFVLVNFPFGLPSYPNLPLQESFDHPKGGYIHDSWEDFFSSCEGSSGKLLASHILRDDSRLGEDVPG